VAAHHPTTDAPPRSDEAARIRARFERLLGAAVAIASEHSLSGVLQAVTDAGREVVGARYAALGVLGGAEGLELVQFVTSGISAEDRTRIGALPTGRGLIGEMVRSGRPIRVARIADHPASAGFPPHHPPMTSFLGVPILSRGRVYGHLYMTDKLDAPAFTAEDEHIAVMLAADAAAAVENARLFDETANLLARVQAMQRQRDQFFAMINHELRNALTGVYGWAEQILRARNQATVKKAAREVYESAERTIVLMNNLLDLSRLDAGRMQLVAKETDLGRVIHRALQAVQPSALARRVPLREDHDCPSSVVMTDAIRLEQILVNLLSNAVRHSRPGDEVVVRAECTGDQILIHIIDRGPGIPQDDQERIFEPFVRVDPESGLGSGLGLPVSRRLAELLGGRLTVHSALGRGATFTVALPATPPDAVAAP
jgi:signal transduction histidine kinase